MLCASAVDSRKIPIYPQIAGCSVKLFVRKFTANVVVPPS